MATLVTVRHGQSIWNKSNRFTGWVDVELSEAGREEARKAGRLLKDYRFDQGFTSVLQRATETLEIILAETGQANLSVTRDKALNERMYGDLQGEDKDEMREKHGKEQVHKWRRSFDVAPPNGESLKDTANRVLPYYREVIEPLLKRGKSIIISAHGNSLRALVMHIEHMAHEDIVNVEIPTGKPTVYELDKSLQIVKKERLEE